MPSPQQSLITHKPSPTIASARSQRSNARQEKGKGQPVDTAKPAPHRREKMTVCLTGAASLLRYRG
ncbi:MAG: hypothetical protein ACR2NZ_16585 [Rubripirellula sp.]